MESFKSRDIKTETGGFRKKIHGFGPDSSYMFEITKGTGKTKMSIKDYILEKYNQVVKFPELPCIDLGKNSYLPMELCRTELKNKKKLTDKETADMIKVTAVKAPDRQNYIQNWVTSSSIQKDPVLKEYDIKVDLNQVQLKGRVLQAPDIQYAATNVAQSRSIAEKGQWDHRNFKLANGKTINKWLVLNFSSRVKPDVAYQFAKELIRVGKIHGVNLAEPLDYGDTQGKRNVTEEDARRLFENFNTKYTGKLFDF